MHKTDKVKAMKDEEIGDEETVEGNKDDNNNKKTYLH